MDLIVTYLLLYIQYLPHLNPFLQKKFKVDETTVCKNCGFERKFNGTASLKKFFEEVLKKPDVYSKTRQARNKLLHGFEDLNKITKEVVEFEDDLLLSIDYAIQFVIGLNRSKIIQPCIGNAHEVVIVGHINIGDFPTDEFEPVINLDIEFDGANDEIAIKPIFNVNFARFSFNNLGWDIYGIPGYNIKKQQIVIKDNT